MHDFSNSIITSLAIHHVGNSSNAQELILSDSLVDVSNEVTEQILFKYFTKSFINSEYYSFSFTNGDFKLNPLFHFLETIFGDKSSFVVQSKNIAQHLYAIAQHPQIKGGDLFVCLFNQVSFNNQTIDAVGIFKSESKQPFVTLNKKSNNFLLNNYEGLNTEKLDKGCIILNTCEDEGYRVLMVDNTNKSADAQYWKDDFLKIAAINDEFNATKSFLNLTKNFIAKQVPKEYELEKTDQIDMLNRSIQYFQDEDEFNMESFTQKVIKDSQVIDSFNNYKTKYETDNNFEIADSFEISDAAVKKQAKIFKSVLKLDKNFHVYIHGNKNLIEQGVESDGRKYYKLYFEEVL